MKGVRKTLWSLFIASTFLASQGLFASISFGKKATILLFVASRCPCTDPHRLLIQSLVKEYQNKGVRFYAIFSNREETKELASRFMQQTGWNFPWLIDHDGKMKEKFDAKVTPEAFLIDERGKIAYRGAIDDSIFNLGRIEKPYLKTALLQLLDGKKTFPSSATPYGCIIVR